MASCFPTDSRPNRRTNPNQGFNQNGQKIAMFFQFLRPSSRPIFAPLFALLRGGFKQCRIDIQCDFAITVATMPCEKLQAIRNCPFL
jgi:hypothetical protein